jgi:membrane-bound ClpP family serine protease
LVLATDMVPEEGYVARVADRGLVGREGTTLIPLRPVGKVSIEGKAYEAAGENALFIERDTRVVVVRDEGGVLYCMPAK